ncbi:unnamed protein product (macronuclear) [Paramecium tetraurelia]|uniref:MARVEL domain-containing protein n=1 Tax=Paramecium tetraurelia TaxID=5888 RepID=A0D1A0_PARTE|nr:uncharacterized protein GSPATT00012341001 [Paramecium tetraurelia]CAK76817.1 unnamed protein product [Paramecium tetraurelia]|eukprot:XP_001444214.1 hypothetical protein (macronuclear) [Paramecium tetraurelia strain d4-2]
MQYQQANINAEYLNDKAQYQQPPQGVACDWTTRSTIVYSLNNNRYQYNPQSQIQYPQQPYVQYAQYPQRVQYGNGYQQQMVVLPQNALVVAVQPINPIVAKEMALRSYTRYFYGCNCCIGVLAMIFLIIRCVASFQQGGAEAAAGVMYIISDFFFVTGAICGIYSISRYVERLLLHYQVLLVIALIFEIIGSIIIFATYGDNEDNDDNDNDSDGDKDNRRSVGLIFFIVSLIIVVICYGMFIRYARQIRYMMIDLNITRANLQNQNAQQVPLQNQGIVYGGAPQV